MTTSHETYKYTKLINGYHCEVEIDTDSEPSTEGHITKGSYSGSMASAFQLGYITSNSGEREYEIPDSILYRIEDWAYSVGY